MDFNEKIILMSVLSNFFKKENGLQSKNKFLLLEPLIIYFLKDMEEHKKENILKSFRQFEIEDSIIYSLLEYFKNVSSLRYNKNMGTYKIYLNEYLEKLNSDILEKNIKWSDFKNHSLEIVNKNKLENINYINFDEAFFNFLKNLLDNNSINNDEMNLSISIILEEVRLDKDIDKYFSIIEDIMHGMAIIKAVTHNKDKNRIFPIIYLDNVFIGNILGWSNNIHHTHSLVILNQLQKDGFTLKIHKETLNIIYKSIKKYRNALNYNKNIQMGTFYYYLKYLEPNNNYLDINNIPLSYIKDKLKESIYGYNIIIDDGDLDIKVNYHDPMYDNINNIRNDILQKNMFDSGEIEIKPSEEQTNYDYIILKNYEKKINNDKLDNIGEIFLTYQQAIIKALPYNQNEHTYSNIMWIKQFSKIVLLDNILSNININRDIFKSIVFDYCNNMLSKEVITKFNNILNNQNIDEESKKLLLAYAADTNNWNEIYLKMDHNEIIRDIKKQKSDIEKFNKDIIEYKKQINSLNQQLIISNKINENIQQKYNQEINQLNTKVENIIKENNNRDKTTKEIECKFIESEKNRKNQKYIYIVYITAFVLSLASFILRDKFYKEYEYISYIVTFFSTISAFMFNIIKKSK